MKLKSQQLSSNLNQLAPFYLISGDETLLVEESCDLIRKACRDQGFMERELFHIEGNNAPWDDVLASANSLSLFSDRKLIELRCKSNKIGDAGSKAVKKYFENINPDLTILMIMPKLEGSQNKSKWVQAIEQHGINCPHWPIERHQLPGWINDRLQQHSLTASADAVQFLADNVEGNLLAAKQEVEKLALLAKKTTIDLEAMTDLVSNSSRYTVFNYIDRLLAGDKKAALRTLQGLKAEGSETTLLVWALAREIRSLYRIQKSVNNGNPMQQAMRNERVFESRKRLVENACKRCNLAKLEKALRQLRVIDQSIKGIQNHSPWLQVEKLTLLLG